MLSGLFLVFSMIVPAFAYVSAAMWTTTIISVASTVRTARSPANGPFWCRYLIFWLHLTQPVMRGLHRNATWVAIKRLRRIAESRDVPVPPARRISAIQREFDWETTNGIGRESLLDSLVQEARRNDWPGDFCGGWVPWDIELIADPWHHVVVHTATEELGNGKRFTRVRWTATPTKVKRAVAACAIAWTAASVAAQLTWAMAFGGVACGVLLWKFI